jgi:hypothetical protein
MRNVLTAMFFVILSVALFDKAVLGQKVTCSCEKVPGSTCSGSVTCSTGCSAICGTGDECYVSCRTELLGPNLTLDFVQKDGKTIAEELSRRTRMQITFTPNPRNVGERYDYHLHDSDIWKLLVFLDKVGTVTVNRKPFDKLRQLQKQIRSGQALAVRFSTTPAQEVAERLSFMSGKKISVVSGDPATLITITSRKTSLSNILQDIKLETGVQMEATGK